MGGIAIVGAASIGYIVAHVTSGLVFTRTGLLVMACIVGAGGVGFIDDWIKVRNERNLGLSKRAKTARAARRRHRLRGRHRPPHRRRDHPVVHPLRTPRGSQLGSLGLVRAGRCCSSTPRATA